MIQYIAENVKMPALQKQRINRWIKEIADGYGKKTGDIAYVFCDDQKILEVNNQYLEHDYYTDIITFDYTTGNTISGDIFISLDTVKSNADEYGADFETELHRILIHGILHLCGNDDKSPELRADMTNKENKALEQLKLMH
mgnify:CR=1 FL=1